MPHSGKDRRSGVDTRSEQKKGRKENTAQAKIAGRDLIDASPLNRMSLSATASDKGTVVVVRTIDSKTCPGCATKADMVQIGRKPNCHTFRPMPTQSTTGDSLRRLRAFLPRCARLRKVGWSLTGLALMRSTVTLHAAPPGSGAYSSTPMSGASNSVCPLSAAARTQIGGTRPAFRFGHRN
jgi:hypothetical protein